MEVKDLAIYALRVKNIIISFGLFLLVQRQKNIIKYIIIKYKNK